MQVFEYVFVGAGTANLAAARRLLEDGREVLVLDSGTSLVRRSCPGVKPSTCVMCERGCSILSGIGGTNALYGNKLCYFPASASILRHFPDHAVDDAWAWLDTVLCGYFDSTHNSPESAPDSMGRKHYHSQVLSRSEFRRMIEELARPLAEAKAIREGCYVSSIRKEGQVFVLESSGGEIRGKHVVLGTGRSGGGFLREICRHFGIPFSENRQDVGFRVEAPQSFFSTFYGYQEDPKFKIETPNGTMRTFCAENRGMIVPVMLDDAFFAEGAYPEPFTSLGNVALMVRANAPMDHDQLKAWCKRTNEALSGTLVVAELAANEVSADGVMDWIAREMPAMPTAVHRTLMHQLVEQLSRAHTSLFRRDCLLNGKVRLFAPAIDNYWPRPELRRNLETSVDNLFIVGDAVGVSRGYVQALTAGAAWATQHLRSRSAPAQLRKPACLSLE